MSSPTLFDGKRKQKEEKNPETNAAHEMDDTLYDDLEDSVIQEKMAMSRKRNRDETMPFPQEFSIGSTSRTSVPVRSLVEEVEHLQKKMKILENENMVLKRNMGTLYRTAKAELQRQDEEVKRLQDEVFQLRHTKL